MKTYVLSRISDLALCLCLLMSGQAFGQILITNTWQDSVLYCVDSDYLFYVETNAVDNSAYTFDWYERASGAMNFNAAPFFSAAGASSYSLSNLSVAANGKSYRVIITEIGNPSNADTSTVLTLTFANHTNSIALDINSLPIEICQGDDLILSATLNQDPTFIPNGYLAWYSGADINSLAVIDSQVYSNSLGTISPPSLAIPNVANGDLIVVQFHRTSPACYSSIESSPAIVNPLPHPNPTQISGTGYGPLCDNETPVSLLGTQLTFSSWTWSGLGVSSPSPSVFQFDPSLVGAGTYTLTYTLTNQNGCTGDTTTDITVLSAPIVSMPSASQVQRTICLDGGIITLTNASPSGGIWSGSGISGTNFDPSVAGSGTHVLTYSVSQTSSGTICTGADTIEILVHPTPVVSAGNDQTICTNDAPLTLSGTPTGGTWVGTGVTPGGIFDPNSASTGSGSYPIGYSYTDAATGCTRSDVLTITVVDPPTAADFTISDSATCTNADSMIFEVMGTAGLTICLYEDMAQTMLLGCELLDGNGRATFSFSPPAIAGSFTLYVEAEAGSGCRSGAISYTFLVNDPPTQASVLGDTDLCEGSSASLSGSSGIANPIYIWLDDTGDTVSNSSIYLNDSLSANQDLDLILFDAATTCYSDPLAISITVSDTPRAVLNFVSQSAVCDQESVELTSSNSIAGSGVLQEAMWDWGDGTSQNDPALGQISQVYASPDTYAIVLTVINANGCESSATDQVIIRPLPDAISLDSLYTDVCVNADPILLETPIAEYVYQWSGECVDTNTGTFNPACEPSSISNPVNKQVNVLITDAFGCSEDFDYVITIVPRPIAAFSIENTCLLTDFSPINMSQNSPDAFVWSIDGTIADMNETPIFVFDSNSGIGSHLITLMVDSDGCIDETEQTIEVYALPEVDFPAFDAICPGTELSFSSSSTSNSGGMLSYDWNLGDSLPRTEASFVYTYPLEFSDTSILVTLTVGEEVETGLLCYDTQTQAIEMKAQPTADFSIEPSTLPYVVGQELTFQDQSRGEGTGILISGMWRFGDGNSVSVPLGENTIYSYQNVGDYDVSLAILMDNGCADTTSQSLIIQDAIPSDALLPDLTIEQFRVNPSVVELGSRFTLQGFLRNIGNERAGVSQLRAYLSQDNLLNPSEDVEILRVEVSPLPTDAQWELNEQIVFPTNVPLAFQAGEFNLIVQADAEGSLEELLEYNNITSQVLRYQEGLPQFTEEDTTSYLAIDDSMTRLRYRFTDIVNQVGSAKMVIEGITIGFQDTLTARITTSIPENIMEIDLPRDLLAKDSLGLMTTLLLYDQSEQSILAASSKKHRYRRYQGDMSTGLETPPLFAYKNLPVGQRLFSGWKAYNTYSFPLHPSSSSVLDVLGDDVGGSYRPKDWRLYRVSADGAVNKLNLEEFEDAAGFTEIQLGEGYLMISRAEGISLSSGPGDFPRYTQNEPAILSLGAGWNLIGNPYNFNVSLDAVSEANPDAIISSAFALQTGTGSWNIVDQMDRLDAIMLWSDTAREISVPLVYDSCLNAAVPCRRARKNYQPLDADNWWVDLELTHGDFHYSNAGIGMNQEADLSYDRFDLMSPPRADAYLDMYAQHEEYHWQRFASDVVPRQVSYSWDFHVRSSQEPGVASLTWDNTYFGDNDLSIILVDEVLQKRVDLREATEYNFWLDGTQSISLHFGSSEYLAELSPEIAVLGMPFPNPTTGRVQLPFSIPSTQDGSLVTMHIVDALGRRIWQIEEKNVGEGFHTWTWEGLNLDGIECALGLYFCQFWINGQKAGLQKLIRVD